MHRLAGQRAEHEQVDGAANEVVVVLGHVPSTK
jgi:hypothetical protein